MKKIILKDINYTIDDIYNFSINSYNLSLSKVLVEKINKSRELVDIKSKSDNPIYGITASYGHFGRDYSAKTGFFSWEYLGFVDTLLKNYLCIVISNY